MPEDTQNGEKTQVYNASWSNPQHQNVGSPAEVEAHKEPRGESGFPKRLLKISSLIFGIITLIFVVIVFILPIFIKTGEGPGGNELVYWGISEDKSVIDTIIADFQKENPNIKINYVKQDPAEYRERLTTRIKNGTGPDIFSYHNSWYSMVSDILSPLPSNIIDPQDLANDYYPMTEKDIVRDGKVYGVPLEVDTLALFVNTQIFSASQASYPKNWQEFIDTATKLTKREDSGRIQVAGAAIGTYDNIDHAPDLISLLFIQNGVDLDNIQKSKEKVTDALQFYKNFALVENNVWDDTLDKSLLAFSQGKVAMVFGYASDYALLKKQNPSLSFQAVPAPQLLESNKKNIGSYWVEGISSKSKSIKSAEIFMEYLSRPGVMEKIYQEEVKVMGYGSPFPVKSLAAKYRNSDYSVFSDQAISAESTPFVDGTFDNGINDNLSKLLKEVIISRDLGDTVIDTLFQGYSQVLGQYRVGL